jgi:hypothetical protein
MITRVQDLCRKLRPVLGARIDRLWTVYIAESDPGSRAEIEQTLELLAAKHLGHSYEPDRSPFPPPRKELADRGDVHSVPSATAIASCIPSPSRAAD